MPETCGQICRMMAVGVLGTLILGGALVAVGSAAILREILK